MSEWLLKKISWVAGWLAIASLFGLVIFLSNVEIKDIDLWLHLAVGKHILQTFTIPQVDILSATVTNAPWINHEWLFQTMVYSFFEAGGIDGLIMLKVGVVLLTFTLLLFLGYSRERQFIPVALLVLVLLVYQLRMTLRPDVFSLLFFVLYIIILGMYLDRGISILIIFLIQAVWSNMHGFFILGPVLVAISLTAEWIKRHIRLPYKWNEIGRLTDDEFKRLKWIMAGVFVACFLNPHFAKGVWYPLSVLFSLGGDSQIFFEKIQELKRPLAWSNLIALQPYMHYRLLILISAFGFVLNRRKIDINAFLLWIVFLIFSLSAVRNIVFFSFAAYLTFIANIQYVRDRDLFPERWRHPKFLALISIMGKIFLIIWIIDYGQGLMTRGYYDFDKHERKGEYAGGVSQRNFPHRAADFLVQNEIKGRFFNDFNSGAYLLGRTFPNIKVFIDGRTEVYGSEFFIAYNKIWHGDTALFDEYADRYQLTGAFLNSVYVPAPSKFIRYLYDHKDWIPVYFDYDAAIFLRDIPQNQKWITRYRMDLSQWQARDAELLKIGMNKVVPYRHLNRAYALYNMGLPDKALPEAMEALRIEHYNTKALKLVGKIYNDRGKYAEGFESLRKAKLIDPGDMKIRYQIALALYHLDEATKARIQCAKVLAANPGDAEANFLMAKIYIKEKAYEKGLSFVWKVPKGVSEEEGRLLEIGELLKNDKEWLWAREVYEHLMERYPENMSVKQHLEDIPE